MQSERQISQSLPANSSRRFVAYLLMAIISALLVSCGSPGSISSPELVSNRIDASEYSEQFQSQVEHFLVDVRTVEEFSSGHIPGAMNISLQSLPERLGELPADLPIVVYCRSGNRSAAAADLLTEAGFSPVYDLGGIQDWVSAGYPIEI